MVIIIEDEQAIEPAYSVDQHRLPTCCLRSLNDVMLEAQRLDQPLMPDGLTVTCQSCRNVMVCKDGLWQQDLTAVLANGLRKFKDLYEDGEHPGIADPGCILCTEGVTPNRFNTGLCLMHAAEQLLTVSREQSTST